MSLFSIPLKQKYEETKINSKNEFYKANYVEVDYINK